MGAVYKARQKQLDRLVALKILPPQVDQAEAFAERFTREARSLAKLNHSHIVTVHDFGHTEAGLYYFIMEFVDGTDLRRVIQTGELSENQALAVVPQICDALQYAHEEGIVHRDIKPENILLNKKGQVKIADFGLAKLLDQPATMYALTQAGQKMGTPHYMAPEQIEHPEQVDHRADIYSLGVVFYEMLTGELPLGQFPLPSRKVRVDVRLDEVVLKTLEKEPELRYQYASEVKTDVETISTGESVSGSKRKFFTPVSSSDPIEAVRHRVWSPSMGLLIAGIINFLSIAGALFSIILSMIGSGFHGRIFPIFYIPGFARFFFIALMGTHAVFVVLGAWNLMQLRSHRLALVGSILAMIPSAGMLIGLPMGIWALILLHKDEIKNAFGQDRTDVSIPVVLPLVVVGDHIQQPVTVPIDKHRVQVPPPGLVRPMKGSGRTGHMMNLLSTCREPFPRLEREARRIFRLVLEEPQVAAGIANEHKLAPREAGSCRAAQRLGDGDGRAQGQQGRRQQQRAPHGTQRGE